MPLPFDHRIERTDSTRAGPETVRGQVAFLENSGVLKTVAFSFTFFYFLIRLKNRHLYRLANKTDQTAY